MRFPIIDRSEYTYLSAARKREIRGRFFILGLALVFTAFIFWKSNREMNPAFIFWCVFLIGAAGSVFVSYLRDLRREVYDTEHEIKDDILTVRMPGNTIEVPLATIQSIQVVAQNRLFLPNRKKFGEPMVHVSAIRSLGGKGSAILLKYIRKSKLTDFIVSTGIKAPTEYFDHAGRKCTAEAFEKLTR